MLVFLYYPMLRKNVFIQTRLSRQPSTDMKLGEIGIRGEPFFNSSQQLQPHKRDSQSLRKGVLLRFQKMLFIFVLYISWFDVNWEITGFPKKRSGVPY